MTPVTEEEREWMAHSAGMLAKRLKHTIRDTESDIAKMRYDLAQMDYVMKHLADAHRFAGVTKTYFTYMLEHARLQIARYAGQLTEAVFQARCTTLRQMIAEIRMQAA